MEPCIVAQHDLNERHDNEASEIHIHTGWAVSTKRHWRYIHLEIWNLCTEKFKFYNTKWPAFYDTVVRTPHTHTCRWFSSVWSSNEMYRRIVHEIFPKSLPCIWSSSNTKYYLLCIKYLAQPEIIAFNCETIWHTKWYKNYLLCAFCTDDWQQNPIRKLLKLATTRRCVGIYTGNLRSTIIIRWTKWALFSSRETRLPSNALSWALKAYQESLHTYTSS